MQLFLTLTSIMLELVKVMSSNTDETHFSRVHSGIPKVMSRNETISGIRSRIECSTLCLRNGWCQIIRFNRDTGTCYISAANAGGGDGNIYMRGDFNPEYNAWNGYYVWSGKQYTFTPGLAFHSDGSISGGGRDNSGEYTVVGSWGDTNEIDFIKRYPTYDITYTGNMNYDGNFIAGTWSNKDKNDEPFGMTLTL